LLNHRIQWFLIINGFLLTATASLKTKPSDDTFVMLIILAVVGLLVCISFSFSLGIGRRGVGRLANMWQHYRDLFYRSEAPTGCHQIGVLGWRANEWASRAAPWYALPIIFAAVWGVLIYANALAKPIAEEKPPMIQVVQPSGKTTKISIDPSLSPSIVIQLSNGGAEIKSPIGATKEKK
jgi:hypothetical protein